MKQKIQVIIDEDVYTAWAEPTGRLYPWLPLEEVRRLAEHTQSYLAQGHEVDTIHVIDGYQGSNILGMAPTPVVLHIQWDHSITTVETPDENGRYCIGGGLWGWTQMEDRENHQ